MSLSSYSIGTSSPWQNPPKFSQNENSSQRGEKRSSFPVWYLMLSLFFCLLQRWFSWACRRSRGSLWPPSPLASAPCWPAASAGHCGLPSSGNATASSSTSSTWRTSTYVLSSPVIVWSGPWVWPHLAGGSYKGATFILFLWKVEAGAIFGFYVNMFQGQKQSSVCARESRSTWNKLYKIILFLLVLFSLFWTCAPETSKLRGKQLYRPLTPQGCLSHYSEAGSSRRWKNICGGYESLLSLNQIISFYLWSSCFTCVWISYPLSFLGCYFWWAV